MGGGRPKGGGVSRTSHNKTHDTHPACGQEPTGHGGSRREDQKTRNLRRRGGGRRWSAPAPTVSWGRPPQPTREGAGGGGGSGRPQRPRDGRRRRWPGSPSRGRAGKGSPPPLYGRPWTTPHAPRWGQSVHRRHPSPPPLPAPPPIRRPLPPPHPKTYRFDRLGSHHHPVGGAVPQLRLDVPIAEGDDQLRDRRRQPPDTETSHGGGGG